jgi:hypothetical protein
VFGEISNQFPDLREFEVPLKYTLRLGFFSIDQQLAVADLVSEWHHTPYPDPFALRCCHFVADSFAHDLALKLREREQYVES